MGARIQHQENHDQPEFGQDLYESIAIALSMGDWDSEEQVMEHHGLTPVEVAKLREDPRLRAAIDEYKTSWNTISNTRERLRTMALLHLEEGLTDLLNMIRDPGVKPGDRINAFRAIHNLVSDQIGSAKGSSGTDDAGNDATRPEVNIYIVPDNKEDEGYVINATAEEVDITRDPDEHEIGRDSLPEPTEAER